MARRALQTRQIGLRTHFSGHPLAPMEMVYEVEKPSAWEVFKRKVRALTYALIYIIGPYGMVAYTCVAGDNSFHLIAGIFSFASATWALLAALRVPGVRFIVD